MRLDELPRSDNVEDRRGDGSGGFPMWGGCRSISVIAVMSAARPLFLRKRKSIRDLAMSQECQKPTIGLPHQMLRVVNARTCAPTRAWHGRSGRGRDPLR
jgi:hypothetical protein